MVTVVINNAGITIPKLLLDLTDDDWLNVIDTNLNGVAYVTRESARRMIAAGTGGSIVNIASILAERVQKALTNYAASKAAVVQFTKTAALELARIHIRVNALCPGYFQTELNGEWFKTAGGPGADQAHTPATHRASCATSMARCCCWPPTPAP